MIPDDWLDGNLEEKDLRAAAARAASEHSWFKRVDLGEAVGQVVARAWDELDGTDLRAKLEAIEGWVYEHDWA